MSHQTGITASEDLKEFLSHSRDGGYRLLKICISDEKLELANSEEPIGTWEQDYDKLLLPQLEEKMPCYILYRLDTSNNQGYQWLFVAWSPDFSPVKEKMIYAATRSTMKSEFGTGIIKEEMFGTTEADVSLDGYKKHLVAQTAKAPLTMAEEELEYIKQHETRTDIHVDTKHQTMQGLAFPIEDDAAHAIVDFAQDKIDYVQLKLDLVGERILLADTGSITVAELPGRIPLDSARYHLFSFHHSHEGDFLKSKIFIYSMPGYKCSIKERMLYSSCKGPFTGQLEQSLNLQLEKKLEIDEPKELTEEFLYDEIHPKKNIATMKFEKPKGPQKRGPRKLLKDNQ